MFNYWPEYVPVAERRRIAAAKMKKLKKKGHPVSPVVITGRSITTTVWGKAWCDHFESYGDFASRIPRGRTYVRNGSVVDLQISQGRIDAYVSGSELYRIAITIKPLAPATWKKICSDCTGGIASLVELLQGKFSTGVMERLSNATDGIFPTGKQMSLACSCPDGAIMCKHVAAVLYGIGARFDHQPELLFTLRQVKAADLIAKAGAGFALDKKKRTAKHTLAVDEVSDLFGIEMDMGTAPDVEAKVADKGSDKKKKPSILGRAKIKKQPKATRSSAGMRKKPIKKA